MLHIVWEFRVKKTKRKQFEVHYSSSGTWAKLFRKSPNYLETIIVRDVKKNDRYLLTDIWKDMDSFRRFKAKYRKEYESLDKECEQFTEEETLIGYFRRR